MQRFGIAMWHYTLSDMWQMCKCAKSSYCFAHWGEIKRRCQDGRLNRWHDLALALLLVRRVNNKLHQTKINFILSLGRLNGRHFSLVRTMHMQLPKSFFYRGYNSSSMYTYDDVFILSWCCAWMCVMQSTLWLKRWRTPPRKVFERCFPPAMAMKRQKKPQDEGVRDVKRKPTNLQEEFDPNAPSAFQLEVRKFLEFCFEKKKRSVNSPEEIQEGLRRAAKLLCSEACKAFAAYELNHVVETYRQTPKRFDLGVFLHVVGVLLLDKTERLPTPEPVVDESDPWPPKEEKWQELLGSKQDSEDHEEWQVRITAQVKDDFVTTMERRKHRWIKEREFLEREKERFFAEQLGTQLTAYRPDAPLVQWFDTFFAVRHRPESIEKHQCLIFDLFSVGYFPRPRVQIKLLDILRKSGLEIKVSPERVRPIGHMSVMGYKEYKELRKLQCEEACRRKPGEDPDWAEEERLEGRYWRKVEQGLVATPRKPANRRQMKKIKKQLRKEMKEMDTIGTLPTLPPRWKCPEEALIREKERSLYDRGTVPVIKKRKTRMTRETRGEPNKKAKTMRPKKRQRSQRKSTSCKERLVADPVAPDGQDGHPDGHPVERKNILIDLSDVEESKELPWSDRLDLCDEDDMYDIELPHPILDQASHWGIPRSRSKRGVNRTFRWKKMKEDDITHGTMTRSWEVCLKRHRFQDRNGLFTTQKMYVHVCA